MEILRLGLVGGALAFLLVGWASWAAGYPAEIAAVRATVGFMGVSLVAYVGELIVATAPPHLGDASTEAGRPASAAAEEASAPREARVDGPARADAPHGAASAPLDGRPQLTVVPPTDAVPEPGATLEQRAA